MAAFVLMAKLHSKRINELIEFFNSKPQLKPILEGLPFPIEQPTRAFFYKGSTFSERCRLIREHYDFLTEKENTARLALETYYFPTRKSSSEVEAIKKAVEDAGKTVTFETAYADKQSAYLGEILLLNDDVTAKREYFMSPVNELSGKVRSAVTGILRNLFNDVAKTSDADIRAMVDAQFASAKNTILA